MAETDVTKSVACIVLYCIAISVVATRIFGISPIDVSAIREVAQPILKLPVPWNRVY